MVEGELALALFGTVCLLLLFGFPVALTLAGTALLYAAIGVIVGHFDASFVSALSGRLFGTMTNETLVAVPLFILMGVTSDVHLVDKKKPRGSKHVDRYVLRRLSPNVVGCIPTPRHSSTPWRSTSSRVQRPLH